MKVRDLIKALEGMDPDATVHIAYNSGDYWRTIVAPQVRGVEEGYVTHSDYHDKPRLVDPDKDEDVDNEEMEDVVVLHAN